MYWTAKRATLQLQTFAARAAAAKDRFVRQSANSTSDPCCTLHEWLVFPLRSSTGIYAHAAFPTPRARAARKPNSQIGLRAVVRCVLRKGPLSIWAVVSLPNDIPWHPICSTSIPLDFAVSLSGTVQTNDSPFPPSARTSGLCAVPAARLPRTHAKEVNYGKTQ